MAHIAQHQVSLEEVENICRGAHIERRAYGGKIMLIGASRAGRVLAVVLDPAGDDVYYPVTARSASRKERRIYNAESGGESA